MSQRQFSTKAQWLDDSMATAVWATAVCRRQNDALPFCTIRRMTFFPWGKEDTCVPYNSTTSTLELLTMQTSLFRSQFCGTYFAKKSRKKAPPYFERSQNLRMYIVQYVYSTEWGAVFEQEIEKSEKRFFKSEYNPEYWKTLPRADRKRSIVPIFQSMPSTLIIIVDTIFAQKRHFSDDSCEMCFSPLLFLRRHRNISGQGEVLSGNKCCIWLRLQDNNKK